MKLYEYHDDANFIEWIDEEADIDEYNFDEAELNKLGIELLFKLIICAIFTINNAVLHKLPLLQTVPHLDRQQVPLPPPRKYQKNLEKQSGNTPAVEAKGNVNPSSVGVWSLTPQYHSPFHNHYQSLSSLSQYFRHSVIIHLFFNAIDHQN